MSFWLTDPELFLYAKGTGSDDVHLWRCKKPASSSSSSSLVVPMKPDDFDYVSNVKNHLELIGDLFDWDETDYKRLVKYISERRLLVNSYGFVIAELYKVDKDGNKLTDGVNEEVPLYIRSLDVLSLKLYIPQLRERPIPLRLVKYLEDVDGKTARIEDSNARVDHLEAENIRLESKNNTLEDKVTKLTAELATQINALATLQHELDRVKNKEVWMNDFSNSDWVGLEGLIHNPSDYGHLSIIKPQGTFIQDADTTNVQARYWYTIKYSVYGVIVPSFVFRVICLEDLTPNKEKARFSPKVWAWDFEYKGKRYVASRDKCIH